MHETLLSFCVWLSSLMSGTLENSFLFHVDDFTTLFNSSRCQQTFCVSFSFYSPLFFLIAVIFSRNLSRDFFFFRIVLLKVIFNYYFFLNCILKIFFEKNLFYTYIIFFSRCVAIKITRYTPVFD